MAPAKSFEHFERIFRHFDENGDGKISPAELRLLMITTVGEEMSLDDAEAAVELADADGDGLLALDEFMRLVSKESRGFDDDEEEDKEDRELREAFRMYEMDGQDCITPVSLKRTLSRLGTSRGIEECTAMISPFDLNGDGVLSFEEFRVMML